MVVTSGSETWPFSLRVTQLKCAARHGRGNGRNTCFMPANAGVDNGRARRFNGLRQLYRFGKSPPSSTRSSIDSR
ncbi:hypothetical protein ACVXHB_08095 [Escherichia coli]